VRDWAADFSEAFEAPVSAVQSRIWAEVYGGQYPAGLDTDSYLTNHELDRAFHELAVPAGGLLGDLACGRGGPGLWLAGRSRARLIGVDVAQPALTAARLRARALGMGALAQFCQGTFEATGLAEASLDGVVTFDALLFSPDKAAAVAEMARIIKPGGRVVMTTWDYHRQTAGRPPQVADHRPLLDQAGFSVLAYDETPHWREYLDRTDELLLEAVDELAAESGMSRDHIRRELEEARSTTSSMIRRVFAVAQLIS
jgi:ubiquinone/menaquinone biosynthesis C-methylase UbiE